MSQVKERRKPTYTLLVIGALTILLALLAILQYNWIGKMTEDELQMEAASLRNRVRGLQEDFNFQIERACSRFEIGAGDIGETALAEFVERYERWKSNTPYPGLIKGLYLVRSDTAGEPHAVRLNEKTRRMEASELPTGLMAPGSPFRPLEQRSGFEIEKDIGRMVEHGFMIEQVPAVVRVILPRKRLVEEGTQAHVRVQGAVRQWMLEVGLIVSVLDMDYVTREMIPTLATTHSLTDYSLAPVFRRVSEETRSPGSGVAGQPQPSDEIANLFVLGLDSSEAERGARWQILIRHKAGSLDAAVAIARRRNLTISFGILVLLAASVVIIILNSKRTQQLAQKQMEFVAGVSHEFRTPLSVIHAISENLADGLISDKKEVEQCGLVIRNDVRRLAVMVEQVLELAGAFRGRTLYQPRAVDLLSVIEQVLATQPALSSGEEWRVETEFESGLPSVFADPVALASALRNVVENAIKYSGAGRWIRISARGPSQEHPGRTRVTIEDRGMGIPSRELDHLFEPFYRGSEVRAAQIHGNGLGLSLVKSIVEAHGGTVSVSSTHGAGSSFCLDLPVAGPEGMSTAGEGPLLKEISGQRPTVPKGT